MFLLGVAAFLTVWFWPKTTRKSTEQLAQENLQAALVALNQGDGPAALRAARYAWEQGGQNGNRTGDIRFALGSAYLLLAGKTTEFDAPTASRRARAELELAQQVGVSPSLRAALLLRLAQARHQTGTEAVRIIPLLQQSAELKAPCAEEAYAFLVDLLLQQKPPRRAAALQVTEKWLLLPVVRQANLARLRRSELLIELEQREEARQTLARIPETAPEFPQARLFLARSFLEEQNFAKAVPLWEQALQEGRPKERLAYVRLMLGHCRAALGQRSEAEKAWQPLLEQLPRVPETLPAWLRQAELRLEANEPNGALIAFDEALREEAGAKPNPYVSSAQLQERLEKAWLHWRQVGNYSAAKRLLEIARTVLPAGLAEERIGLTCQEAGQFYLTEGGKQNGAKAEALLQQAQQSFRTAGEAYAKAATAKADSPEQAELWWKAAQNLLRGQSYARAVTVLETYLARDLPAQRKTEALIGLGEALQAMKESDRAAKLLTQVLEQPHPLEQRARYLLALAYIDQKKFAEAEAILRSIATARTLVNEPPELRQSRFAMGYVLFRQQQYAEAVSALEAALQQFPDDPQALPARFQLAEACLQAGRLQVQHYKDAKQEAARDYYRQQRKHYYDRALKHFQQLAQDLSDRQEQSALSTTEENLLRSSRFGMGDCLFQLGRVAEAVSVYESLALHHNNQPAGLTALMHLAQCNLHLQRKEEAKQVLERLQTLLKSLPDADLTSTRMTRQEWQEWATWASKECADAPADSAALHPGL